MSNMRMRTVIWYGERLENYEMRKLYPGSFLHGEWRDTKRYYQSAESEDTGLHKEKRLDTAAILYRSGLCDGMTLLCLKNCTIMPIL